MNKNQNSQVIKLTKYILILLGVILILLSIIFYQNVVEPELSSSKNQVIDYVDYCGTVSIKEVDLTDTGQYKISANFLGSDFNPENGELLFKFYCAGCHKMTSQQLVGSGMEELFSRVPNRDWLLSFMLNTDSVINSENTYNKNLLIKSNGQNLKFHPFVELGKEELIDLLGYIGMR